MPDGSQDESWRQLCEAIMKETDPKRLMQLVVELNSNLALREAKLRKNATDTTVGSTTVGSGY
jgi:hypothetical protein